jgi:hypothetical protein
MSGQIMRRYSLLLIIFCFNLLAVETLAAVQSERQSVCIFELLDPLAAKALALTADARGYYVRQTNDTYQLELFFPVPHIQIYLVEYNLSIQNFIATNTVMTVVLYLVPVLHVTADEVDYLIILMDKQGPHRQSSLSLFDFAVSFMLGYIPVFICSLFLLARFKKIKTPESKH